MNYSPEYNTLGRDPAAFATVMTDATVSREL